MIDEPIKNPDVNNQNRQPEDVSKQEDQDVGKKGKNLSSPAKKDKPDLEKVNRKSLLESILFIQEKPLPLERISKMLDMDGRAVRVLLKELAEDYDSRSSGIQLNELANGFLLSTRQSLGPVLRQYYKKGKVKLNRAALEALAIIAYKQPVTRLEIEEIRGAGIGNSLQVLLERKLIRISGRKNVVGHPLLYATSRDFLVYFGLKNLESLPTIKEIREMEIQ